MSNVILAKRSDLQLGLAPDALTSVTGQGFGTDNIGHGEAQDVRAVPGGRGTMVNQLGNFRTFDFSLSCDSNVVHDSLFRRGNLRRFWGVWRPEGQGAGRVEYTFQAVATVVLTFDLASDAVRWSVTFAVDGAPVESTQ